FCGGACQCGVDGCGQVDVCAGGLPPAEIRTVLAGDLAEVLLHTLAVVRVEGVRVDRDREEADLRRVLPRVERGCVQRERAAGQDTQHLDHERDVPCLRTA